MPILALLLMAIGLQAAHAEIVFNNLDAGDTIATDTQYTITSQDDTTLPIVAQMQPSTWVLSLFRNEGDTNFITKYIGESSLTFTSKPAIPNQGLTNLSIPSDMIETYNDLYYFGYRAAFLWDPNAFITIYSPRFIVTNCTTKACSLPPSTEGADFSIPERTFNCGPPWGVCNDTQVASISSQITLRAAAVTTSGGAAPTSLATDVVSLQTSSGAPQPTTTSQAIPSNTNANLALTTLQTTLPTASIPVLTDYTLFSTSPTSSISSFLPPPSSTTPTLLEILLPITLLALFALSLTFFLIWRRYHYKSKNQCSPSPRPALPFQPHSKRETDLSFFCRGAFFESRSASRNPSRAASRAGERTRERVIGGSRLREVETVDGRVELDAEQEKIGSRKEKIEGNGMMIREVREGTGMEVVYELDNGEVKGEEEIRERKGGFWKAGLGRAMFGKEDG